MPQNLLRWIATLVMFSTTETVLAVIGGAGIDPNTADSPWAGVGAVLTARGHYTGALIGPRHVLTAAHVVRSRQLTELGFQLNLSDAAPLVLPVAAVHIHPGYQSTQRGRDGFWRDDLAVLELAQPAPQGVPFYALYTDSQLARSLIAFVGYGQGGDGQRGTHQPSSPRVKRVGYNRIDALLPHGPSDPRPVLFLFDFDGPDYGSNRFKPDAPQNATLGHDLEATFAAGDSGAPVFVWDSGAWKIAGVAAFVAGQEATPGRYGSIAGGALVPAYLEWIRAVLRTEPAAGEARASRP